MYDPEGRYDSDINRMQLQLDYNATFSHSHHGLIIYICCFPPTTLSKIMSVIVTIFGMASSSHAMNKAGQGEMPELNARLISMSVFGLVFTFAKLYGLNIYAETVTKNCLEAVQKETEFSYLANFLDSSLLVVR